MARKGAEPTRGLGRMADTGENHGAELQQHQATWSGFKAMMTWGTLVSFLLGAFVVFLIAPK